MDALCEKFKTLLTEITELKQHFDTALEDQKFERANELRSQIDPKVQGLRMEIRGGVELPRLNKAIEHIEEKYGVFVAFLESEDQYEFIDGKLNGVVEVCPKDKVGKGSVLKSLPVIDGELVTEIDGNPIEFADCIKNVNGTLNGKVGIGEKRLPVINGEIIGTIGQLIISGCENVENIDGKLNGEIKVGEKMFPVVDGELINEIEDFDVTSCSNIKIINGKINGFVNLLMSSLPIRTANYAIIDNQLIDYVDGHRLWEMKDITNHKGTLNGKIRTEENQFLWQPVIDGKIISQVDTNIIENVEGVMNTNGKLTGVCTVHPEHLPKERDIVVIEGEPVYTIDGKEYIQFGQFEYKDGFLNGSIKTEDGAGFLPCIDGKILETFNGQKIVDAGEIYNIFGALNGELVVINEKGEKDDVLVRMGKEVYRTPFEES